MKSFNLDISESDLEYVDNTEVYCEEHRNILEKNIPHGLLETFNTLNFKISKSDVYDIERLELKNVFNIVYIISLALIDAEIVKSFLSKKDIEMIYESVKEECNGNIKMEEALFLCTFIKFVLDDKQNRGSLIFRGKVPEKRIGGLSLLKVSNMLSGRENAADTWIKLFEANLTNNLFKIISRSNYNYFLGLKYLVSKTAYYLNKVQPNRFFPREGELEYESQARIFKELLDLEKDSEWSSISKNSFDDLKLKITSVLKQKDFL